MEKKITVHVLTYGVKSKTYLSKGEAEKAKVVLSDFGLDAVITTEKRTATIV